MEVVAPNSAPILVMVARSGTVRVFAPSPPHSMMAPTPPLTDRISSSLRAASLAVTKGRSLPVSSTLNILGILI